MLKKYLKKFKTYFLVALFGIQIISLMINKSHAGTLDDIKKTGNITLGVRESSSLSYSVGKGQFVGFHVDLCKRIAQDIKKQLNLANLNVKYQAVTSQNRIPLLQNKSIDLECGTTSNNLARQREVDFAPTTVVEKVRLAVKRNSSINSFDQLDGKTVAITTGTSTVQSLRKLKNKTKMKIREIFGKDHNDSFLMLENNKADAFVMDESILASLISKAKSPSDYKIVGESLSSEPVAIMYRKNDPEFKKMVDNTVKEAMQNGGLLQLWVKWFQSPVAPYNKNINLPLNEETKLSWEKPNNLPAEAYIQMNNKASDKASGPAH